MTATLTPAQAGHLPGGPFHVEPYGNVDIARDLVVKQWGADAIVIAGKVHRTDEMVLAAALSGDNQLLGVAYYRLNGILALLGAIIVLDEGRGVGSALFDFVVEDAQAKRFKRLRAITTNDNFGAMQFYQKRGLRFMSLFPGGVAAFRAFKPGLIEVGMHGIPCRDVIELEMDL